jgi:hypothetical protein
VDPVPDPPLLRKCGSAGNRTRDLWASSQECILYILIHIEIYIAHVYIHNSTLLIEKSISQHSEHNIVKVVFDTPVSVNLLPRNRPPPPPVLQNVITPNTHLLYNAEEGKFFSPNFRENF